jgi:hypothetical protein
MAWTLPLTELIGGTAGIHEGTSETLVRFEVFTAHTSFLSHFVFLRSVRRLLVTANVVPTLPILVTLMKEALSTSKTSVLKRATRRNIPEDDILQKILTGVPCMDL